MNPRVRAVQAEMMSVGRYARLEQACENLSEFALDDLLRLIRDLKAAAASEKNKRRRGQFWG